LESLADFGVIYFRELRRNQFHKYTPSSKTLNTFSAEASTILCSEKRVIERTNRKVKDL